MSKNLKERTSVCPVREKVLYDWSGSVSLPSSKI
jgi:hypothetical protein